jgi:hypothetical protein
MADEDSLFIVVRSETTRVKQMIQQQLFVKFGKYTKVIYHSVVVVVLRGYSSSNYIIIAVNIIIIIIIITIILHLIKVFLQYWEPG